MANGKGSSPREYTKEGHDALLKNWNDPYPERKPGKPGRTTYVWRDGKLVDKEKVELCSFIEAIPPVDYKTYKDYVDRLQLQAIGKLGVSKELLGLK